MKRKILVVDDDDQIRTLISRIFQNVEIEIIEATNGQKAMENIKKEHPDLILLDINMPGIKGNDILRELKKDFRTLSIPVIILTGNPDLLDKIEGLQMGADDYINKPFNIEELKLKVINTIRRHNIALSTNPLTGLPGAPMIENLTNNKIKNNEKFALMYIDIDNFKKYNDNFGYFNGDKIIKLLADILKGVYDSFPSGYFAGHIGGDDFVIICNADNSEKIADEIIERFDNSIKSVYEEICQNHNLNRENLPLLTLSIAIVSSEEKEVIHYAKMVEAATQVKKYLKSFKDKKGSMALKDRRNI